MRFNIFLIIVAMFSLSACSTSYNPNRTALATPINSDTYRINTSGNGFTKLAMTKDFGLLRASELARAGGYPYFIILNQESRIKTSTVTTPGSYQSNTYGTAQAQGYGNYATATGNSTTYGTYTPPRTTRVNKPRSEILVKLLKNKPSNPNIVVYDANLIFQQLNTRIRRGSGIGGF